MHSTPTTTPRIKVEAAPRTQVLRPPPVRGQSDTLVLTPDEASIAGGSLLTQYSIIRKIGGGGMGVVYLARDNHLGRFVAIKRLTRKALTEQHLRLRFMEEAKSVAALNHIYIVHVYTLGEDSDGPYIVMEFIAGPEPGAEHPPPPMSLADYVTRHEPLAQEEAIDLLIKLCRAMEYAHICGVIHRDLKPTNVLLDESGEPKIVDFGLARRAARDDDPLTVPGEKMLSLGYGAPEQESDASLVDERADVYGLGALLYFSITGRNPRYFRENDVPALLREPLCRALDTDRDKRWSSVAAFRQALELIKAPSSIDVPTVKTTWRCKWCDTINPTAIPYCGQCGWDGRERCAECGAETRVGIQFCGECGADAREYEMATRLLSLLRQYREDQQYEAIISSAGAISGFQPVGDGGRKLLRRIHRLTEEAQGALVRRRTLRSLLEQDIAHANYEQAQKHLEEYHTLSEDTSFDEAVQKLPRKRAGMEIELAQRALKKHKWETARQICRRVLDEMDAGHAEAQAVLNSINNRLAVIRITRIVLLVIMLPLLYLLLAPPLQRRLQPDTPLKESGFFASLNSFSNIPLAGGLAADYLAYWQLPPATADEAAPTAVEPEPVPDVSVLEAIEDSRRELAGNLAKVETEMQQDAEKIRREYIEELRSRQHQRQRQGDFDGWAALKYEIDRFHGTHVITYEIIENAPPLFRDLQERYLEKTEKHLAEKDRRLMRVFERHLQKLADRQRDLTRRNLMDEAMLVNREIKRIESLPEFVAAQQGTESRQQE